MRPPIPQDESARLEALRRYDVLDSEPEQAFDDLTALAASICGVPISLITFVDADRQWFKSRVGLDLEETSRDVSFCAHAMLADGLFVVPDTAGDRRFAENPLVVGGPAIRFYAGKPLVTPEGHALGALSVLDREPRELTDGQLEALDALGRQALALLEHRRAQSLLRREIALVELLRESATAANEAAGLNEALVICIERVCERIGWPVGHAYALERDGEAVRRPSTGVWRVPAEVAYQDFREEAGARFSPREGPLARVLAGRRSLWIPNIGAEPTLARRAALDAGLFAAVFVPVLVRDEVVAVLEFYSDVRDEPDRHLLEVMGNLGTQLGRVVERERSERALARRLADLRAVLDATAEGICLSDRDGAVRFVNSAMEELWGGLGVSGEGSIWERLLQVAERAADPEAFARGVHDLVASPGESAGGEFELTDGRSFVGYTVPVGDGDGDEVDGRIFVFRETTADREVERLKEEFLASVSHELRTPLTSVLGYTESLRAGDFGPLDDDQRHALHVVERNAGRLNRLIDDLLLTARIESQSLDLHLEELDLATLAAESVQAAAPGAEAQGVRLVVSAETVRVQGDRLRLGQLLDNLVSNAVKFTPEDGTVTVSLASRDGQAVLEVADTGIGIPDDEHERLFERFYRATTARERSIEGTGLGLVIARAIAEAHDGEIGFESREGEGTTFRVLLPLAVAAGAEAAA